MRTANCRLRVLNAAQHRPINRLAAQILGLHARQRGLELPDPSPQGGLTGGPPSKTEMQSPRFISAFNICRKLEPHGGPPPGPGFTEAQLLQMLAKWRCLRQHGFPNLPDPDVSGDNIGRGTSAAGWNPDAPAAIQAMKACAKIGIGIPGWLVS